VASAILGKWGKNLAVRLPLDIVKAAGLHSGERVDVETRGGDIIIRKADGNAVADAQLAAEEIVAESEVHPLDETTIIEMLNEGRRG
jgi:antitoxin component of MazEF toxin-antitoxin module